MDNQNLQGFIRLDYSYVYENVDISYGQTRYVGKALYIQLYLTQPIALLINLIEAEMHQHQFHPRYYTEHFDKHLSPGLKQQACFLLKSLSIIEHYYGAQVPIFFRRKASAYACEIIKSIRISDTDITIACWNENAVYETMITLCALGIIIPKYDHMCALRLNIQSIATRRLEIDASS